MCKVFVCMMLLFSWVNIQDTHMGHMVAGPVDIYWGAKSLTFKKLSSCFPKMVVHFKLLPVVWEGFSCSAWKRFPLIRKQYKDESICDAQGTSNSPSWASWVMVGHKADIFRQLIGGFGIWHVHSSWRKFTESSWGGVPCLASGSEHCSFPSAYYSLPHAVPSLRIHSSTVLVPFWYHLWKDQDPAEMFTCLQVHPSPLNFFNHSFTHHGLKSQGHCWGVP